MDSINKRRLKYKSKMRTSAKIMKAMSVDQLVGFLENYYTEAYKEGVKDGSKSINHELLEEIELILRDTQGVGEVLLRRIIDNLKNNLKALERS